MNVPTGIKIIDNVVSNSDEIVDFLQEQPTWSRSQVLETEIISHNRTSDSLFIPMLSWSNSPLIHDMNFRVWQELDEYATEYGFTFSEIENVSVNRYQVGDSYSAHIDSDAMSPRIVSAVLYLNNVERGGQTYFNLFDYFVEPIAGRLAIFPSNYIYKHEALPPQKGIKIAAAYWARP